MNRIAIFLVIAFLASCIHKNSKEEIQKFANKLVKDKFTYKGKYVWAFDLMSSEQVSTHTLYADSIVYKMTGKVYATAYTMKKLSYNKNNNKWIGEDKNGIVYTLFFKDKNDGTLTIYKRKCKTNGLEEAIKFTKPKSDATSDHGWNIYSLNGHDTRDVLPLSGHYNNDKDTISIKDKTIIIDGKVIKKNSFHSGERRWVGKHNHKFVQLFFKPLKNTETIVLSIQWSNNLQELYSVKYHEITNWKTYKKR